MLSALLLSLLIALFQTSIDDVIAFTFETKIRRHPANSHLDRSIHRLYAVNIGYGASESSPFVGARRATDRDIPRIAELLSYALYTPTDQTVETVPLSQRKELARLEVEDLSSRYGSRPKAIESLYPSALFLYEEDNQVIGCVGIDCQIYCKSPESDNRFTKIGRKLPASLKGDEEVVVVLANLCVRPDARKKGVAQQLLKECYKTTKQWNYKDIYLLVDETNDRARRLYQKQGFKPIFRDEEATCIVYGSYSLKTAPCVNICYRKSIQESNPFQSFFNMFGK